MLSIQIPQKLCIHYRSVSTVGEHHRRYSPARQAVIKINLRLFQLSVCARGLVSIKSIHSNLMVPPARVYADLCLQRCQLDSPYIDRMRLTEAAAASGV